MSSFSKLATVSCSTKRATISGSGVNQKRGAQSTNLSGLLCLPLDPVDPELRERLRIETPHELRQTFIKGDPDILEGDTLVVNSVDYPIKSVAEWVWQDDEFLHLIVEHLKK